MKIPTFNRHTRHGLSYAQFFRKIWHKLGIFISFSLFATPHAVAQLAAPANNDIEQQKQQLLAQMHDIQMPQSVNLWPLAPGYWLCFALLLLLAVVTFAVYRYRKNRRYRVTALTCLAKLQRALTQASMPEHAANISPNGAYNKQKIMQETLFLLKQVFYTAYPNQRHTITKLDGIDFLQQLRVQTPGLAATKLKIDRHSLYGHNTDEYQLSSLLDFAEYWIKHHPQRLRGNTQKSKTQTPMNTHPQEQSPTATGASHV